MRALIIFFGMGTAVWLCAVSALTPPTQAADQLREKNIGGYLSVAHSQVPATFNAGLTEEEREQLQKRIENIHRSWSKDRDYLAPPTVGTLCELDPALLVTPPAGKEAGYVPIATRQEWGGSVTQPRRQ